MTDPAAMVNRAQALPEAIGNDLAALGGYLRCTSCDATADLGDVGFNLRRGWPKCCGYTMTWITQRLIDTGEAPARF